MVQPSNLNAFVTISKDSETLLHDSRVDFARQAWIISLMMHGVIQKFDPSHCHSDTGGTIVSEMNVSTDLAIITATR